MKISLEWLREYADLDAPVDELVRLLVDTGTEVGAVELGGEGLVVDIAGAGADGLLTINFPNVGQKMVMLKYAPLERV